MIEMEQKTCLFEIFSPENPKGVFYFEDGVLYDAVYGSYKGVDAALKMIQLDSLKINFRKHPNKIYKRSINKDLIGLIMEAMRLKDESSDMKPDDRIETTDKDTPEIEEPVEPVEKDIIDQSDFSKNISEALFDEIKALKGYRAVGVISNNGEVLACNSVDNLIDFNSLYYAFNDLFIALDDINQQTGLMQMKESFYISNSGMMVIISMKLPSDELIFIVTIFQGSSNQGMIKLTLKKIADQFRDIHSEV